MKFRLTRLAKLMDKYGWRRGIGLYLNLRYQRVSGLTVPGIETRIFLRSRTSDVPVFEQVFLRGDYDFGIPFQPGWIVDAGANIGLFSVLMKNRYPASNIICVEPSGENVEVMRKNLSGYAGIHMEQAGLWHSDGQLNIIDRNNAGFSALAVEEVQGKGEVPAISMDAIFEKYGIDHIDILKLDIEGNEERLFEKNYENWMPKVKMIVVELHDWLKPGCSKPFFDAVQKVYKKYSYAVCNENTIIINHSIE